MGPWWFKSACRQRGSWWRQPAITFTRTFSFGSSLQFIIHLLRCEYGRGLIICTYHQSKLVIGVTAPLLQGNGSTSQGHRTPGALLSSHPAQTEPKPVSLINQSNFYSCSGYLVLLSMKSRSRHRLALVQHTSDCVSWEQSLICHRTRSEPLPPTVCTPLITTILPFKYVIGPSSDATSLNNGIKRYKPEFLQPTGFHRFMLRRSNNQETSALCCSIKDTMWV